MKFGIGIPTLNRGDLLIPSLQKYLIDFKGIDIHVVDNGKQGIRENVHIYEPQVNLGVAASWNYLCKKIFETHDYALLINDDVYLGYGTQKVEEIIQKYPNSLVQSHISWSVVLISKSLYKYVGDFDERFYPAYYEDSDYLYRMKLLGIRHHADIELNPETIRISMTYEKAPDFVNNSMKINRERYIEKWGGVPLLETNEFPFKSNLNDLI